MIQRTKGTKRQQQYREASVDLDILHSYLFGEESLVLTDAEFKLLAEPTKLCGHAERDMSLSCIIGA